MNYNKHFHLVAQSLIITYKNLWHLSFTTFVLWVYSAYKSCLYLCLYILNFISFNFYMLNAFSYKTHCIYCITFIYIVCSWTLSFHFIQWIIQDRSIAPAYVMSWSSFSLSQPELTRINQHGEPHSPHCPSLYSSPLSSERFSTLLNRQRWSSQLPPLCIQNSQHTFPSHAILAVLFLPSCH